MNQPLLAGHDLQLAYGDAPRRVRPRRERGPRPGVGHPAGGADRPPAPPAGHAHRSRRPVERPCRVGERHVDPAPQRRPSWTAVHLGAAAAGRTDGATPARRAADAV